MHASERRKREACSTGYSQAVTHPSTKPARRWLTSVIGREPVFSAWYGRRQVEPDRQGLCIRRETPHRKVSAANSVTKRFQHIATTID